MVHENTQHKKRTNQDTKNIELKNKRQRTLTTRSIQCHGDKVEQRLRGCLVSPIGARSLVKWSDFGTQDARHSYVILNTQKSCLGRCSSLLRYFRNS